MSERPVHQIERYTRWLAGRHGRQFDATTIEGYDALWRWSTGDLGAFWGSIWDYFGLQSPAPFEAVLEADAKMPGARWFAGAQVNYAQQVFRHADAALWHETLKQAGITVDLRGDRLRVGFGLYQTEADVKLLLERLLTLR